MKQYLLKRILLFIPTLVIISLFAFIISVNAPGDPLERMVIAAHENGEQSNSNGNLAQQKKFWEQKLGLNLPVFYLELSDFASPDTLYKISNKTEKECLQRLLAQSGNWNVLAHYFASLQEFQSQLLQAEKDSLILSKNESSDINLVLSEVKTQLALLKNSADEKSIASLLQALNTQLAKLKLTANLSAAQKNLEQNFTALKNQKCIWKNYVPVLHFHANNQYHRWIFGDGNWWNGANSKFSKGILRGDFGTSYASKEAVSKKIGGRLLLSLFFTLLSVILAYLISIPIAIKAAEKPHSSFDNWSSIALFSLYSLPSFFLATLLLMTFSNPDVLPWLPASGLMPSSGISENTGFWHRIQIQTPYFILPLICYTYSSLAFLSRSMRSALLENLNLDYIRTARAKGLSERIVLYKHAFKNALLPMITLFANVFPYAIGGSVVLESIFTLPGMGLETYTAIQNQDYPVLVAVFTLTGCLALLGTLLSDILYAWVDPRISFSKNA